VAERAGSHGAGADQGWYTLRDVATALGLSRQAVHARVRKGQLPAQQVEGVWRIPSSAVAEAVQAERRRFVGSGAVRILPVSAGGSGDGSGLSDRVSAIEAAIAELSEDHRQQLAERDRKVAVLEERCERLTRALHHMVDLLGVAGEPARD
jgi:hypothetical protein